LIEDTISNLVITERKEFISAESLSEKELLKKEFLFKEAKKH
jgi:hypothetical protein